MCTPGRYFLFSAGPDKPLGIGPLDRLSGFHWSRTVRGSPRSNCCPLDVRLSVYHPPSSFACRVPKRELSEQTIAWTLRSTTTAYRPPVTWYVSIAVDTPNSFHLPKAENQGAVGVDLGVPALATLSTGEPPIPGPKAHKALLDRLRRLSRSLSRKTHGSANRRKARATLARLHARIAAIRSDALHKLTTDLTRRFHTTGIEDLNVRGMMATGIWPAPLPT